MLAMSEKIGYGFAVGRVRSQETTLLDRSRYDRLVRARDIAEFRAVLNDTAYSRYLSEEGSGDELGQLFVQAAQDNFAFLAQYCADAWVLDVFRLKADVHNLKLFLKLRLQDSEPEEASLMNFGKWTPAALRALAETSAGDTIPISRTKSSHVPATARLAVAALLARQDATDPAVIDTTMDRLEQEMGLALVQESPFLAELFAIHADVENLRAFARVKATGQEQAVFDLAFLPGGTIPKKMLVDLLSSDWDAISARFRFSRYHRLVEEGAGQALNRKSMLRMERIGRETELGHLRLARYATFGYEPLVSFYSFRENEITNLRQLQAARSAGLPEDDCREMVAYVE